MGLTNWREYFASKNDPLKINTTYNAESYAALENATKDLEKISNYSAKEIKPDHFKTLCLKAHKPIERLNVEFTVVPSGTTFNEETMAPEYPVEMTDIEYMQKNLANSLGIPKKYIVYATPEAYSDQENVLLGHKGYTFFDKGLVYAPYIPLQETPDPAIVEFESRIIDTGTHTRAIKSRWTAEMATDIRAYHNIDAESELTALLAQELGNSIGEEIFNSVAFPHIQRVASRTLGLDIVSVQPMGEPSGQLFYFNPVTRKEIKIEDIQDLRNEIEKGIRLIERWRDAQRGYDLDEYQRRDEILYHFKNILYELDGILLKLGRTSEIKI